MSAARGAPPADDPARVHLSDVQRLLALFTQGLAGAYMHLKPVEGLTGDFRPRAPTTDGTSIYLPESVATFDTWRHNLGVYRIAVLHQLGFFENGTFEFDLERAREVIDGLPPEHQPADGAPDLDRFFGLWESPLLAQRLFMTLEDLRIDLALRRRYPGARADLERVLRQALAERPDASGRSPFAALLEGLLRHSLGEPRALLLAADETGRLAQLLDAVAPVESEGASVYDSAAAAADCYRILDGVGLPRRAPVLAPRPAPDRAQGRSEAGGSGDGEGDARPPDEDEIDAMSVSFRGEVRPGLVQRRLRSGGEVGSVDGMRPQDDGQARDARELARPPLPLAMDRSLLRRAFGETDPAARSYLYDEWDFHHQRYIKGWCRLYEHRLEGEDFGFLRSVHERHAELAQQVRRQFRFIRPESYQRVRRVSDGPELDLDGIIEAVIDRRSGQTSDERVHMRRDKAQREVAAAFLLDMSASTDYPIPDEDAAIEPELAPTPAEQEEELPILYGYHRQTEDSGPEPPKRCVLDVAKESLALMCEALEHLGDLYAVYGFSGYGHEQVEFHVAKEFQDRLSARTWGAMAAMKPQRSTRMGPAIRHALTKLDRQAARLKLLVIVSDGFPEDRDYGPDRNDHEYGIQDTAMALREAERLGIQTFCVTIDRSGHDYLRRMCPDQRYLVIDEVADLPRELTKVYRTLTL